MRPALHYYPPSDTDAAVIGIDLPAEVGAELVMTLEDAAVFENELKAMILRGRTAKPAVHERSRYPE